MALLMLSSAASAQCPPVLGDLGGDGNRTVTDVQCSVLVTVSQLGGAAMPSCLAAPAERADVNCDTIYTVSDTVLIINLVLGQGLPLAIDGDGSGCPDACEVAVCGDGACDAAENCLDCPEDCVCPATAFRINTLVLKDPHLFVGSGFFCVDLVSGPLGDLINPEFADALAEPNALDILLVFRPLAPAEPSTPVDVGVGDCEAGVCTAGVDPLVAATANQPASGPCFAAVPGTLNPAYGPGPAIPTAPCFSAANVALGLEFGGVTIPITNATVAARYVGAPPTSLVTGALAGFLPASVAASILLPPDFPVGAGSPLSAFLRGGAGNSCAGATDLDSSPQGPGWWFYFEFTGSTVDFVE
jgi:hypothetical protein